VLLTLHVLRQTATLIVENGVVLKFKRGRGIFAKGKSDQFQYWTTRS